MVRKFQRKTDHGKTTPDVMLQAVRHVKLNGISCNKAAIKFGIPRNTLRRYMDKIPEKDIYNNEQTVPSIPTGYWKNRQVFNEANEKELVNILQHASEIFFGLNQKEVRILSYQMAVKNNLTIPKSWTERKQAGSEWQIKFLEKHKNIHIRKAVASLPTANSFNRTDVDKFFDILSNAMESYNFEAHNVWSMDEIGITSVKCQSRVITRNRFKLVSGNVYAEGDNLVTLAVATSASGNSIPPFFIFPRNESQEHCTADNPKETMDASKKFGWMYEDYFIQFLKHFHSLVDCTFEKPILLLLENHKSYLSIRGLTFARKNGIILLSIPPDCSDLLQPMGKAVFTSLKQHINSACNSWIQKHPEKPMTIYNIPEIVTSELPKAIVKDDIKTGFQSTGIYPLNARTVLSHVDFASECVPDVPNLKIEENVDSELDKPATSHSEELIAIAMCETMMIEPSN